MPNTLTLLPPGVEQITHDPTKMINGDPLSILGDNPYGEMTDAIIFGAVNTLLGWIDDATGLDLLGIVTPLEELLGTNTGLLSGLIGWLTPGAGTIGGGVFGPLLGLIPGLGGGTGTLGGLGTFLNPTDLLSGPGIFSPIMTGGLFSTPLFIPHVEDLILGRGIFTPQYPPYNIPYTPSASSQVTQEAGLIRRFFNWGDITAPDFNFNTAIQHTIITLLSQNMLAGLIDGTISPDVLPPDLLNMLKQIITLGIPNAVIPTAPTDIITLAISAWNSWWAIITGAQQQATTAVTQAAANTAAINQQITGGTSIVDTVFNTVMTSNINPNYFTRYLDSGGGGLFADGIGNIIWLPSGGMTRTGLFLPPGVLNTDNFEVQLILDPGTAIPEPIGPNPAYIWLIARSNDLATQFTAARIGFDNVTFGDAQAVSGGSFIPRIAPIPITSKPGDSWILRGGYTGDPNSPWALKLFQNNFLIDPDGDGFTFIDTGHNAAMGETQRRIGGGMTAGSIDSNNQLIPPKITSITASDRLASAA